MLGFGASYVIDHNEHQVAQKIRSLSNGNLQYAMDCVGKPETTKKVFECLSTSLEGHVSSVLNYNEAIPNNIKFDSVFLAKEGNEKFLSSFTDEFHKFLDAGDNRHFNDITIFFSFSFSFSSWLLIRVSLSSPINKLGKIVPGRIEVLAGLQGIPRGLMELASGVSGKKLVAKI